MYISHLKKTIKKLEEVENILVNQEDKDEINKIIKRYEYYIKKKTHNNHLIPMKECDKHVLIRLKKVVLKDLGLRKGDVNHYRNYINGGKENGWWSPIDEAEGLSDEYFLKKLKVSDDIMQCKFTNWLIKDIEKSQKKQTWSTGLGIEINKMINTEIIKQFRENHD